MPGQSYPIDGIVYDNNWKPIVGASVYVINLSTTNPETLQEQYWATTNEAGEYVVNLQHLGTYSDGDSYELIVEINGYRKKTKAGTVTVANGGEFNSLIFIDLNLGGYENPTVRDTSKMQDGGLHSQYNRSFQVWANDKAATAAFAAVTSGGDGRGKGVTNGSAPLINLGAGEVAYIQQITIMVRTAAKVCAFKVVHTASADGAGTATDASGEYYAANGTLVEAKPFTIKFANPIKIEYDSARAKSVAISVKGTDTSTKIDFSMEGYIRGGGN